MKKGVECPCVKTDCERHGDCAACAVFHHGKPNPPFCARFENITPKEGVGDASAAGSVCCGCKEASGGGPSCAGTSGKPV